MQLNLLFLDLNSRTLRILGSSWISEDSQTTSVGLIGGGNGYACDTNPTILPVLWERSLEVFLVYYRIRSRGFYGPASLETLQL